MSPADLEPPSLGLPGSAPWPEPAQLPPVAEPAEGLGQDLTRPHKSRGHLLTRAGFALLLAATIGGAAIALVPTFFPSGIEGRWTLIVPALAIAGGACVYWGRHAWPPQGHAAAAGFGLILAASGSTLFLAVFGVPDFLAGSVLPSAYPLSVVFQIISVLAVLTIGTIGFLLLVWKFTSEAPRKLILAGSLISFAYFAASNLLVVATYDPNLGGPNLAAQPAVGIFYWFFVPVVLITTALTALGLLVAEWRLGTPSHAAPEPAS